MPCLFLPSKSGEGQVPQRQAGRDTIVKPRCERKLYYVQNTRGKIQQLASWPTWQRWPALRQLRYRHYAKNIVVFLGKNTCLRAHCFHRACGLALTVSEKSMVLSIFPAS